MSALYHIIPGTNSTTQLDSECFIPHDTRHKQHHTIGQWVLYTTWYQAQTAPHSWTVSALYHMIPGTNSTTQLDSECFIPHDTGHKQHHTVGQWVLYTTWYRAQTAPHSWTASALYHIIPGTNSTTQLDSECFIPHDTRHKQHHTVDLLSDTGKSWKRSSRDLPVAQQIMRVLLLYSRVPNRRAGLLINLFFISCRLDLSLFGPTLLFFQGSFGSLY